jgi:hypothetical protein
MASLCIQQTMLQSEHEPHSCEIFVVGGDAAAGGTDPAVGVVAVVAVAAVLV